MESIHSERTCEEHNFHYQPLANPGSSIRLIETHPEPSDNGLIQLHIFDSPLTEEYTCLSYVWGPESDQHYPILLNGETFHVRENLYGFLNVARRKYPGRRLWIDAICINQADTTERNYQVQQMGKIYSRAREVIAWLGNDEFASSFIARLNSRCRHNFTRIPANILNELFWSFSRRFLDNLPHSERALNQRAFSRMIYIYWQRAWITQEIILAQHVRILVDETEFDLIDLKPGKRRYFPSLFPRGLAELHKANTQDHKNNERYLLSLLSDYGEKACAVERDRVYSLLSICVEGANLQVDYSLSEKELVKSILRVSELTLCLCSAEVAFQCVNVADFQVMDADSEYFVKFTTQSTGIHKYKKSRSGQKFCCLNYHLSKEDALSLDGGQVFCLTEVCPVMDRHLVLIPQQPGKPVVKAVLSRGRSIIPGVYSLGNNGDNVEICALSRGDSYRIKLNIRALFLLSTRIYNVYKGFRFGGSGYGQPIENSLCGVARQPKANHSVEYLNLGGKTGE